MDQVSVWIVWLLADVERGGLAITVAGDNGLSKYKLRLYNSAA